MSTLGDIFSPVTRMWIFRLILWSIFFPVSFGICTKFYYQNSYCIVYITYHLISRKCWYSKQINLWWWAIPKIFVYLISRFYSNRENFMLAKYTCFTVLVTRSTGDWWHFQGHRQYFQKMHFSGIGILLFWCNYQYINSPFYSRFINLAVAIQDCQTAVMTTVSCSHQL